MDLDSDFSLKFYTDKRIFLPGEVHIILNNTSSNDITITIPTNSSYTIHKNMDALTIPANSFGEVNIIRTTDYNFYIRAI